METTKDTKIILEEIITHKSIKVLFQPIVDMKRKMICGVEGLIRGIDWNTKEVISPIDLFKIAKKEGRTLELDRLCREKVLEAFQQISQRNLDIFLFLNIEASIIGVVGRTRYLSKQVKRYHIDPRSVVIEINEKIVRNDEDFKEFVMTYKKMGFLIALDDVGAGYSNLNRIPMAKPDVIKIDMSLIRNINHDYYKQEVFKSLRTLSKKIGGINSCGRGQKQKKRQQQLCC